MKKYFSKKLIVSYLLLILLVLYVAFSHTKRVEDPLYGVSFNTIYAQELGLNWKEVYDAIIDDLGVKRVRLAAHWTMVEKSDGQFNFSELDYQVQKAQDQGIEVIFAIGKRLPRWPECHIPEWALNLSQSEQEDRIIQYITTVVNRYKGFDAITVWQVENEPYLSMFAKDHCFGFDEEFLKKEIELVKNLDTTNRRILVTDSGELSTWIKPFSQGDMFGTTMYVYSWNSLLGAFRNPFLPGFYSVRQNILQFLMGDKEVIIAELALEPWLDKPIIKERTDVQISRMSPQKFDTVIEFAKRTGISTQYLWGAEWWYYMKIQGNEWYWKRGQELFSDR